MKNICREKHISPLTVFVDPYAYGFYEKMGAVYRYDSESSIEGRRIPVFEFEW